MPNPIQTGTYLTPPPPPSDGDFLGPKAKYQVVSQNGRQYLADANGSEQFVIVIGSGKNISYKVTSNYNEAVAALLKEFGKSGGVPALKKALLDSGYSTKADFAKGDYLKGLVKAVQDFSTQNVAAYAYEGKKDFITFSSFLKKVKAMPSGNGAPKPTATTKTTNYNDVSTDLTTIDDAYTEINDYMLDTLGRDATKEEKDAYYQDIHNRELKSPVTNTSTGVNKTNADGTVSNVKSTGTTLGAKVGKDERTAAQDAIIRKALIGTSADKILASAKGSKIAQDIASIQKSAADYGQPMTADQALKYVIDGYGNADYVAKQTERLRLNAMTMFGNLKDHIQNGGTVKDIADQYAYLKSKKLGIALTDSMADKDVLAAITRDGGLQSTADFTRQMQANPLWRQTEEAHNTSADFANTILKSFGFMG